MTAIKLLRALAVLPPFHCPNPVTGNEVTRTAD